jgi:hypothetical protein
MSKLRERQNFILSPELIELIEGEVLGDGGIYIPVKNARSQLNSSKCEYTY